MQTTNTCGILVLHPCHSSTPPLLILLHHREQPPENWQPPAELTTTTSVTCTNQHHHLLKTLHICRSRKWDSNGESFRTQNFDYNFDEEDDDEEDAEQWLEALEDYIDSIWIFKGLWPAQDVQVPGQKYETISFHRVLYPGSPPRTSSRVSYSYHLGARKSHGASSSGNIMRTNSPGRKMNCPATETLPEELISSPVPSAPPIENLAMADASIDSPSIHTTSADSLVTTVENLNIKADEKRNNILAGSSCAICLDAPTEAACVPCGHMAGCMTCLNEIKNKNWGCPVCRVKIEMVLRLFAA